MKLFSTKPLTLLTVSFTLLLPVASFLSVADVLPQTAPSVVVQSSKAKSQLIDKLDNISFLSASFSQQVFDEEGNALQEGAGEFNLSKPNKVRWHTQVPDETLIVSDGDTLWFYDPFIEQVSAHSLANAIVNTPILLLTNDDKSLWDNYNVVKVSDDNFDIIAIDVNSQVKSLSLQFDDNNITAFKIKDSTGQLSVIELSNVDVSQSPAETLFQFSIPEGVELDDQR